MEYMCFGGALQHILRQDLATYPHLGKLYISKVDLANAHIRLWLRMDDVLSVAFVIPNNIESDA